MCAYTRGECMQIITGMDLIPPSLLFIPLFSLQPCVLYSLVCALRATAS